MKKSDEEWKSELTNEQYRITREAGTEPAFSGKYYDNHEKGIYHCLCCNESLFSSEEKYDSGVKLTKDEMQNYEQRILRHPKLGKYFVDINPACA